MRRYLLSNNFLNTVVLSVYTILLIAVICFHEPWYDEAQSWLIARDASLIEIIFRIPHYEGHPPLWWLILAIPAKLGLPYEISLKTVQIITAVVAEYLVIFKSPFPKWIRYLLPFTYFLFYQYGVQARPYGLMICAICLCAMTWGKRDIEPFPFSASLSFLCLTGAYGIIIAGGIAIAWTIEIVRNQTLFLNKQRLIAMFTLLMLAIVLLLIIYPSKDAYANRFPTFGNISSIPERLLLFVFCLPAEAMFTSFASDIHYWYFIPEFYEIIVMVIISTMVWLFMIILGKKVHTYLYLILPFILLAMFSSIKYFCMHHLGVLFLLFLFNIWISWQNNTAIPNKYLRIVFISFLTAGLIYNISWSLHSSITDIAQDISFGRVLTNYIKDNSLENYSISVAWQQEVEEKKEDIKEEEHEEQLIYENTHEYNFALVEANPYFDTPLLKGRLNGHSYVDYREPSREEMDQEIDALKRDGVDIIIGGVRNIYFDEIGLNKDDFIIGTFLRCNRVWKNKNEYKELLVLIHKNIS